ncbi:MAG TPA: ABC transporter substrate-binding protein [Bacillota bacterium]|nr:ABC transporter substrate-binding protein [Bacillota bacterium]
MRVRVGGISALTIAALLVACGGAAAPATSPATTTAPVRPAKQLSIAIWSAPDTLNPVVAQTGYDQDIIGPMYDTLVWESPDQQFHPLLAASWDVSSDSRTFTFHLDPKATWTDGQPVTSADVAYTLQLNTDPAIPSTLGSYMSMIQGTDAQGHSLDPAQPLAGVSTPDANTIQIQTKTPIDPYMLLYNIAALMYVVPQHALKSIAPADFAKAPVFQNPQVTDGPYKFVKYVTSQYAELAANASYHLGKPPIDTVYIKIVPPTSMLAELRDGEIDVAVNNIPLQDWPTVATLPNVKQDPVSGLGAQFVVINTARPYLASPAVRDAIAMAIDRQAIVSDLLKGEGTVPTGPFASFYTTYYDTSLKAIPYDTAGAKAALAAAGFPANQALSLLVPTGDQIRMETGPLLQQDLQAAGLNVQIRQYDFGTMIAQVEKGNFDFALVGSSYANDPLRSSLFFTCKGSLNLSKFCDPLVDQAYQQATSTSDAAARKAAYDRLQEELQKQEPFVFLYDANGLLAYNTRVMGTAIPNAYGMQQPWHWDVK